MARSCWDHVSFIYFTGFPVNQCESTFEARYQRIIINNYNDFIILFRIYSRDSVSKLVKIRKNRITS